MLKFLTHKLRTHSLNEDPSQEKADDDHDSGTESDDEFQDGSGAVDDRSSLRKHGHCPLFSENPKREKGKENASQGPPDARARPSTATEQPSHENLDAMEDSGSPGPPDSAVPSDSDFGASLRSTNYEFTQRDSLEDVEDEIDGGQTNALPSRQQTRPCLRRENELSLNYNDQHSSEEELEVINGPKVADGSQSCSRTATVPEKRKWSQVNNSVHGQCQSQQQLQQVGQSQQRKPFEGDLGEIVATCSAPVSRAGRELTGSGSSDDEVQGLLIERSESGSIISQPVQFRTSPPVDAHKPGRSLSPPPKLFHASAREPRPLPRPRSKPRPHTHLHSHLHMHLDHHHHNYHHYHHQQRTFDADVDPVNTCSPRKRHRPPQRVPRPCLDFEKMQQLKARAITTWRHSGEHGNELSVFCW